MSHTYSQTQYLKRIQNLSHRKEMLTESSTRVNWNIGGNTKTCYKMSLKIVELIKFNSDNYYIHVIRVS
jgi:hypothetical protein